MIYRKFLQQVELQVEQFAFMNMHYYPTTGNCYSIVELLICFLPCLYSTLHLEYPLVLSRFCFCKKYYKTFYSIYFYFFHKQCYFHFYFPMKFQFYSRTKLFYFQGNSTLCPLGCFSWQSTVLTGNSLKSTQ